ncbi:MAG: cyclic nucleotide-binding domain-containing protein [Gemmatimonadetes bacterium]|nr:cyclic nucleotide-binding domain-containing protein [Gemmatimonadota bacterium]
MSAAKGTWSVDQVVALLRRISFFEGLPEDDLQRVAGIVKGRALGKGETLFREGEPGDAFYVVFRGAIEILKDEPGGKPEWLAVRRDGAVFGEMSLLDDAPRSATARAAEDTQLLMVEKEHFRQLLGNDALSLRIMRNMAMALRTLNIKHAAAQRPGPSPSAVWGEEPGAYTYGRLVQRALLPRNAPAVEGYDMAAGVSQREDGRGTALWDWFTMADGRAILAAVSAHGQDVPAAHQLAVARALFRHLVPERSGLEGVLGELNNVLAAGALDGLEQPVECALVAVGDGEIEWTSAGQAPGAIIRPDRTVLELSPQGPPLGILEGFQYPSQRLTLQPADALLVAPGVSAAVFKGATDLAATIRDKPAADVVAMLQTALAKVREQLPPGQDTLTLFLRREA